MIATVAIPSIVWVVDYYIGWLSGNNKCIAVHLQRQLIVSGCCIKTLTSYLICTIFGVPSTWMQKHTLRSTYLYNVLDNQKIEVMSHQNYYVLCEFIKIM